jgi:hypothetical protein
MTTKTKPTIASKIRHALRDFSRTTEGQFTFDREIRTYDEKYIR